MSKEKLAQKIKEVFESTIEANELRYNGTLENIDYFGLCWKAIAEEKEYKFFGLPTYMYNYVYKNKDAVMIIFSIPNGEDASTKYIADRVIGITETLEKIFVTLDYIKSTEEKDGKFIYVNVIITYNNKSEEEN